MTRQGNNYLVRLRDVYGHWLNGSQKGIFGFSTEDAYQRIEQGNHPSKKRKKFGRR